MRPHHVLKGARPMKLSKQMRKLLIADLTSDNPQPFSLGEWDGGAPDTGGEVPEPPNQPLQSPRRPPGVGEKPSGELAQDLDWIHRHFNLDVNRGLVIRKFTFAGGRLPGAVIYLDDQVDWDHLNRTVIAPLMHHAELTVGAPPEEVLHRVAPEGQGRLADEWSDAVEAVLGGFAAVLLQGYRKVLVAEAKGWAMRQVDRPTAEITVRGPQEGFTEDIRTNLSLVRRRIRSADLVVEWRKVGRTSRAVVMMVYLKSVANPRLVGEVRRRLSSIEVEYMADSGEIEQLIEDRPYSLYPSLFSTERPDRVAAQVAEGFVGILVENTPFALVVPGMAPMFLQTPEDNYLRWPYGAFLRVVRVASYIVALLLPATYVAIANFHQEMIPTALVLAISSARESVPVPTFLEVWFMESMFELIREAGVRVPSVIGPTIGIVGALILGQAAVQAQVISPIMVIITSATALSSFAIPNYNMQFAVRILRFVYIAVASVAGLFGITLLFVVNAAYLASGNSFGVPWFAPISPFRKSKDIIIRYPTFQQEERPATIRPRRRRMQSSTQRPWAPRASGSGEGGESDA